MAKAFKRIFDVAQFVQTILWLDALIGRPTMTGIAAVVVGLVLGGAFNIGAGVLAGLIAGGVTWFAVGQAEKKRANPIELRPGNYDFLDSRPKMALKSSGVMDAWIPVCFEFVSHTTDAEILKIEMLWIKGHNPQSKEILRRFPFNDFHDGQRFPFLLKAGTKSAEFVGFFAADWQETNIGRLPQSKAMWVLDIDCAGPSSFRVPFAKFRENVNWLQNPPAGQQYNVWPDEILFGWPKNYSRVTL